jgi:hypothetical protein
MTYIGSAETCSYFRLAEIHILKARVMEGLSWQDLHHSWEMEEDLLEAVRASGAGSVKICSNFRLAEIYSLGAKVLEELSWQDLSDA